MPHRAAGSRGHRGCGAHRRSGGAAAACGARQPPAGRSTAQPLTSSSHYSRSPLQGSASTLTRSDVRGGGKKPYKQKGTGNARRGSSTSPLFPGGGVTFGPKVRR